jgi:hypothetical protein
MSNDTVSSLEHAFDLSTVGTLRETLERLAEIAECPILLRFVAFVAFHDGITWPVHNAPVVFRLPDVLLTELLLVRLLSLTCLLLRHFITFNL